jgi:hypothetical protein
LQYKGVPEYLEDLVARIDAPLLDDLAITFFHQLIFDTPQLTRFISRTPKFNTHDQARVFFSDLDVFVTLPQAFDGALELVISCRQSDWQLSSVAQVCGSSFPRVLIAMVEHLYILEDGIWDWQDGIENGQWLELFTTFYRDEVFLHIPKIHVTYRARPTRALRGKCGGGVTRPSDSFLGGATPIGTCQRSHWPVRCHTTAYRSPSCHFSLGRRV